MYDYCNVILEGWLMHIAALSKLLWFNVYIPWMGHLNKPIQICSEIVVYEDLNRAGASWDIQRYDTL